jgi:hypothetical protein
VRQLDAWRARQMWGVFNEGMSPRQEPRPVAPGLVDRVAAHRRRPVGKGQQEQVFDRIARRCIAGSGTGAGKQLKRLAEIKPSRQELGRDDGAPWQASSALPVGAQAQGRATSWCSGMGSPQGARRTPVLTCGRSARHGRTRAAVRPASTPWCRRQQGRGLAGCAALDLGLARARQGWPSPLAQLAPPHWRSQPAISTTTLREPELTDVRTRPCPVASAPGC